MADATEPRLGRPLLLLLAAIVLVPLVMMALAVPMMGTMGWWWGGHAMGANPLGLAMALVWLLVLVGLGYLVVRAVTNTVPRRDPALEELRRAYARGELSDEEFEDRRDRLERD